MRRAAFLEVFEDAAVELVDFLEAFALHERPRLFTANAAGAEHDDRSFLHLLRQPGDGRREIAELGNADGQGIAEGAELDLVVVAGVEKGDGPAFIEPLLEFKRRELGRRALCGLNAFDTKGDDLFLEPHEHAVEGLMLGFAVLCRQVLKPRDGAQFRKQRRDGIRLADDEEIDPLGAQQDGPFERASFAKLLQSGAERLQVGKRGKFVGGDVLNGGHVWRASDSAFPLENATGAAPCGTAPVA